MRFFSCVCNDCLQEDDEASVAVLSEDNPLFSSMTDSQTISLHQGTSLKTIKAAISALSFINHCMDNECATSSYLNFLILTSF